MNKTTSAIIAGILVSGSAFAGHNSQAAYDYAKVTQVEPIIQVVRTATPRQECWQEQVAHYNNRGYRSATPTLLGSIIGGAIGNELGNHKDAKRAGIVVGALLGGSIGRDIGHRTTPAGHKYYTTEEVCKTYEDYHDEERITGYQVEYKYRGNIYHTETQEHPGKRIKVRVEVTPVEEYSTNTRSYY